MGELRRKAKEIGQEIGLAFKGINLRKPPAVKQGPPLAFAVVPTDFKQRLVGTVKKVTRRKRRR